MEVLGPKIIDSIVEVTEAEESSRTDPGLAVLIIDDQEVRAVRGQRTLDGMRPTSSSIMLRCVTFTITVLH